MITKHIYLGLKKNFYTRNFIQRDVLNHNDARYLNNDYESVLLNFAFILFTIYAKKNKHF